MSPAKHLTNKPVHSQSSGALLLGEVQMTRFSLLQGLVDASSSH